MSAIAPSVGPQSWIINPRADLVWFIGSCIFGYMVLVLFAANTPLSIVVPLWILIDRSHVFCTATRTYLDKRERSRRKWQLLSIVPITGVAVMAWAVGVDAWLIHFANTYAVWHIGKQHFGIAMIYKRKAGERGDVRLDKVFLMTSFALPCALYLSYKVGFIYAKELNTLCIPIYFVFAAFYIVRQIRKIRAGEPVSVPKLLLFAGFIPISWLVFLFVVPSPGGLLYGTIAFNIGHALQYHRLMWFHNNNHYGRGEVASDAGLAARLARRWSYYLAAAVALYLGVQELSKLLIYDQSLLQMILFVPLLCHYYLDGHIWRVRGDKELATALNL